MDYLTQHLFLGESRIVHEKTAIRIVIKNVRPKFEEAKFDEMREEFALRKSCDIRRSLHLWD